MNHFDALMAEKRAQQLAGRQETWPEPVKRQVSRYSENHRRDIETARKHIERDRPVRVTCTNAAAIVKDWRSGAITLIPILAIDFSTPVPQEVNP